MDEKAEMTCTSLEDQSSESNCEPFVSPRFCGIAGAEMPVFSRLSFFTVQVSESKLFGALSSSSTTMFFLRPYMFRRQRHRSTQQVVGKLGLRPCSVQRCPKCSEIVASWFLVESACSTPSLSPCISAWDWVETRQVFDTERSACTLLPVGRPNAGLETLEVSQPVLRTGGLYGGGRLDIRSGMT